MAQQTPPPKVLFVMLRHVENADKQKAILPDHLAWMRQHEDEGSIFLSGPTDRSSGPELGGVTVIRSDSFEQAKALLLTDPMIVSGAMTYSLHRWTVNEGRISLNVHLSDHSGAFV